MLDQIDIHDLLLRWDGAYQVDGRVINNIEMLALTQYHRTQRRARIDARDCTDCEGPLEDERCRLASGQCAYVIDARRLIWDYANGNECRDDRIDNGSQARTDRAGGGKQQPDGH